VNPIVCHFAAGHALLTGTGVLLATLRAAGRGKAFAMAGRLFMALGFIIFSAALLPLEGK
jgi:hypothetical protein